MSIFVINGIPARQPFESQSDPVALRRVLFVLKYIYPEFQPVRPFAVLLALIESRLHHIAFALYKVSVET